MNWKYYGLAEPVTEFRFHPTRRWRFDFAWPDEKVAVEVNGGIWIKGLSGRGGAHSLPSNIIRDMEKLNAAQLLGWSVYQFTPDQMRNGQAAAFLLEVPYLKVR